ncbi:hypothetical protein LguiA_001214 [Lonicera macranthoides]
MLKILASFDSGIRQLKAFDDTKAGVKGLVDAGVSKLPRIFVHEHIKLDERSSWFSVPIIDLKGIHEDKALRTEVVLKVGDACENLGFFQVINHRIPASFLTRMIDGLRQFNEQDIEVQKVFYSCDNKQTFVYNSNFALYSAPPANWRDTFECIMAPHPPDPEKLACAFRTEFASFPCYIMILFACTQNFIFCRDIMLEYSSYIQILGIIMLELFSEALGYLTDMNCAEGRMLLGQYYPVCPEPELTFGASSHSDSGFFTVLLQDQTGGLQMLIRDRWLIKNYRFKSANHRVQANSSNKPRISIASFFRTHFQEGIVPRVYGPIKGLLSEENPPIYKETTIKNYLVQRFKTGFSGTNSLSTFKLDYEQADQEDLRQICGICGLIGNPFLEALIVFGDFNSTTM